MAGGNEALQAIRQDLEIRTRTLARWHWGSHDVALLGIRVVLGVREAVRSYPAPSGDAGGGSDRKAFSKMPAAGIKRAVNGSIARLDYRLVLL